MFHGSSSSSPFFFWLLVKLVFWVGTWKLEIIDRVGKYSGQQMNRLGGLGFSHCGGKVPLEILLFTLFHVALWEKGGM